MTHPTPIPAPTPACAAFEPLLPLLDTNALTPDDATATREHITGCAWCRAQRAGYDTFEAALRRQYGSDSTIAPAMTLGSMMRTEDVEHTHEKVAEPRIIFAPVRHKSPGRSRRMLPSVAAALIASALVLTLIVNRLGATNDVAPSPLPTLARTENTVMFVNAVPWGRLQINGRIVHVTADSIQPALLYLPSTSNTITYTAAPFPTLHCVISVPESPHDTCPYAPVAAITIPSNGESTFRPPIIDLQATPKRLPKTSLDALIAATQQQLNTLTSSTQVLPGDHYLTANGKNAAATQPLTVSLSYQMPTLSEIAQVGYAGCAYICPGSQGPPMGDSTAKGPGVHWTLFPVVRWQYTSAHGQTVSVHQGPSYMAPVDITANWTDAWHVGIESAMQPDTLLGVALAVLSPLDTVSHGVGGGAGVQLAATPADGFLLYATEGVAYVLYRAGALVALDSNAHHVFPTLPMASAHELAIARQLGFKG